MCIHVHSCALKAFENVNTSIFYCAPSALRHTMCMTIWFYMETLLLFGILFFSLWGSKLCQLCSGSTCSTAICIFIFTFIVADNAGLSASALVAMNFATKNAQAAQEAGRQKDRETDSILVTLCQKILQLRTRSSSFKAVKLVFAERN